MLTLAEDMERKGIEKGRQEGIEKGRQEGIEKGRQEGIEKGRQEERIKMIAFVKNLKRMELTTEQIAKASGLTEEEIEQI